ncbi:hypothetical protein CYMTET_15056 [Cymbomonas tetramitiformis]|uniref:DUF7869 domain-containing protein n=1 Tax=Cymbomonas tetramitiformis TaxID=36881 RepID=A0AAE0L9Q4_9CHLO|nr:hypothetical protein CYMTET_15056 [Cymbomonas tetramitiformis]
MSQKDRKEYFIKDLLKNSSRSEDKFDFKYFLAKKQVCFKFYYMACGISYGYLQDCRTRVLEGRHTFVHGLTYEEDNRKVSLKRESVVAWLEKYADEYGQPQPHKPEKHLSDGLTIEELWDEYLQSLGENEESKKLSLSYWYKIFEEDCSKWLKIPSVNRFSHCDVCASFKLLKEGLTKSQKGQYNGPLNKHLAIARAERQKFYKHGRKANMTKSIAMNKTWHKYASVIIDGMTQWTTRLPHFRRIPKHLDSKDFLDVHNMGSMIENVGRFMDFNYANFKDDANFLVNVLHRDILRIQEHRRNGDGENSYPMPEVLYVQLDNVSTNKSKLMLAYAAWLVHTGVFRKVKLNFLLVGHTHENIDQMFSRFSVRLRRKQAWTLDEMIEVAQECFTDGVICEHTEKIFDFSSWFDGHVFDCHNILAQQAFKFKMNEHGEVGMQYKQYSISPKWLPETPLPKLVSTPPVAGPGYIKPIPFTEEGIEKLEHTLQALKDILGTKLTEVHEKFWREDVIEKQRHLTAGGECQAPAIPFQHPEKIAIERNATLVRLIEAPALAIEAAGAAAVPAIPVRIQRRIDRAPIEVYNGKRKHQGRAQRRAEQYVDNAQWEVTYGQMTGGSFAVALAVESENDKFAFRVQLKRSEWSDPLYLVKVEARYPSTQQLQYRYFQPKKHTDTKKKHLGKQLASHVGAFAAPPGHRPSTETFDKNEIVLAWNGDAKDPERSIPNEQYAQIVVALLAQQSKRTRKDLGDLNESDDSDEDEAFDNCVAVAVAPEVDA